MSLKTTTTKICYLDNIAVLELLFLQPNPDSLGNLSIQVKNLTQFDLSGINLFIEFCDRLPQTIASCNQNVILNVPELKINTSANFQLSFKINPLNPNNINAGIISYNRQKNPFANVYQQFYAVFEDTSRLLLGNANINGVVYADGTSNFRMQLNNSKFYNITGKIDTIKQFNMTGGRLHNVSENNYVALTTDTLNNATNYVDTITYNQTTLFRVKLQDRLPIIPNAAPLQTILLQLRRTL